MDIRTFDNADSGINRDIIISLHNGSDPTPGAKPQPLRLKLGTTTVFFYGSSRHIINSSSKGTI
jgi:hypothetical protein